MRTVFALILASISMAAQGQQSWPSQPIHIIAPAAAGSGTDLMARLVGKQMAMSLGQPVIVENKVGGGGTLGVDYVVRAAPDGYTLLLSTDATVAIQPHVVSVSYDTLVDLAPIGEVSSFPMVVVGGVNTGIRNIADLVRVVRANPKGVSYGMGGKATGGHIIGETIRETLNVSISGVSYPSAARAVHDVLGGFIEIAISDVLSVLPHIESERLKAVAIASRGRTNCLKGVPTLSEQGVPFDLPYSYGLLAPAKTPEAVVDRLNKALNAALNTDTVQERLKQLCQTAAPAANSPADFARQLKYHHSRWGAMIRAAGIKL